MNFDSLVKQLANRINQPQEIRHYLLAVWRTALKEAEKKQLLQTDVSISLFRAKKYARHQHFLGTQGKELVEFEDWKQD